MTTDPLAPARMTALEMAVNLVATVQPLAEAIDRDPVQAVVLHLGDRGHAAAEMAGNLALVSLAQDFHRVAAVLLRADTADIEARLTEAARRWAAGEPTLAPDATDDARATRDHMRRWAEGDDTHRGEGPPVPDSGGEDEAP